MRKIKGATAKDVGVNGFCYQYRNHTITISPGFCGFHGEIYYNPSPGKEVFVDSGSCGLVLDEAIERINARIDRDLKEQGE